MVLFEQIAKVLKPSTDSGPFENIFGVFVINVHLPSALNFSLGTMISSHMAPHSYSPFSSYRNITPKAMFFVKFGLMEGTIFCKHPIEKCMSTVGKNIELCNLAHLLIVYVYPIFSL